MTKKDYNININGGVNMINLEVVSKKFSQLRTDSGITQKQIAEYLGVDQSYISKCEQNERQFSLEILEKVSNLFGCPIDYFTNGESKFTPMPFALRAKGIETEDFEAISIANKLALNLRFMEQTLREE